MRPRKIEQLGVGAMPYSRQRWYIHVTVEAIGGNAPLEFMVRKHNNIAWLYEKVRQAWPDKKWTLITHDKTDLSDDRKKDFVSQHMYEKEMREYLERGRKLGDNESGVVLELTFTAKPMD